MQQETLEVTAHGVSFFLFYREGKKVNVVLPSPTPWNKLNISPHWATDPERSSKGKGHIYTAVHCFHFAAWPWKHAFYRDCLWSSPIKELHITGGKQLKHVWTVLIDVAFSHVYGQGRIHRNPSPIPFIEPLQRGFCGVGEREKHAAEAEYPTSAGASAPWAQGSTRHLGNHSLHAVWAKTNPAVSHNNI